MLRRPQRVPPLSAGAVLFLRKAKRNVDVARQMIGDKKGERKRPPTEAGLTTSGGYGPMRP